MTRETDPAVATSGLAELIARRAAEHGDHPYLEDARSERRITYGELATAVHAWTRLFDELGLPPSSAVLIDTEDPLDFAVVHLAAVASGRRSMPVDPGAPASELERLSRLIRGAALLVIGADTGTDAGADLAAEDARRVDGATRVRVGDDRHPTGVEGAGTAVPEAADPAGSGSVVLFTSGSTGTPKGVELPERQLLFVAGQVVDDLRLVPGDRGFNSLPLHHVNAEVVGLLATLAAGATLVLDRRFRRTGFWQILAERRITWLNAVPAILAVLARSGPLTPPDSLRLIRCASSPLPEHVRAELGDVPLVQSWGMTEGASQICSTGLEDVPAGSVGRPRGAEVQARRLDGGLADAGEIAPLWIRGPGIVERYLFGAAADRFDPQGWLSTGDLGGIDADGVVTLAGRADDVINRGGEKVYPGEVEEVLLEDARVLEAVVVGRPDDVLGAVPVAYVIPVPELPSDQREELRRALQERAAASLARFRRPVEITVVDDLPRAAAGKVQRSRVRELEIGSTAAG